MAELVTLRPDNASINDDSDATFLNGVATTWSGFVAGRRDVTFQTVALGTRRVEWARMRWRHSYAIGAVDHWGWIEVPGLWYHGYVQTTSDPTIRNAEGAQHATNPAGGAWRQQDIDAVRGSVVWRGTSTAEQRLYEAWLDLSLNRQPTLTDLAVAGFVTSRPRVAWTFNDADNDVQERCQLKVYRLAETPAPNPDSTTPFYDSGEVFSTDLRELRCERDITVDGEYRFFVRASQPWNGPGGVFWSAWAQVDETVIVTRPDAPSISAVSHDELGRVHITVTNIDADAELVTVERSDDDGETWVTVRGAEETARTGPAMSFDDYEAPPYRLCQYRVRAVDVVEGEHSSSAWSGVAHTMWRADSFWVKVPGQPELNRRVRVTDFRSDRRWPQQRHDPLGASVPIVSHEGVKGHVGPIEVMTLTAEEHDDWMALVAANLATPLLVQTVLGDQFYLSLGESLEKTQIRAAAVVDEDTPVRHAHRFATSWTEVAAP